MVTWLFVDFQMMRCFHFVGFPVMLLGVVWVRGKEELVYLLTNVTLQCGQWRAWEDNWVSFTQAVTLHPPSWWFLTGLPLSVQTAPRKLKPVIKAAAAAKSLQSCPTLCDPIDGSPPGSPVPGILQARTLEWVAKEIKTYLRKLLLRKIQIWVRMGRLRTKKRSFLICAH